jgi:NADPH-dependent 2,4-dienoyl-CoA reductase/sulfur reductase-like enzyme/nitrite reductase/ring-hydroxylating ferredoxin subunit
MPEFPLHGAADLKENEKKLISAGKTKILVLRHQGKLSAFQSKCPHAGGPLEKGAICNGRLVCPWHMGTFRIPDGRRIEPPAMDSLETYPLRIEDSEVVVTISSPKAAGHQKKVSPSIMDKRRMVIVGAGAAGSMAAKTLRDEGFSGEIIVIDPCHEEPIDRTMLTKMALTDKTPFHRLQLHCLEQLDIIHLRSSVKSLQAGRGLITLSDGKTVRFDAALVATGGTPKRLPMQHPENVHTIRHIDDLKRLRSIARKGRHAIVLGTSFIGMEAASALRQRGLTVTVIGKEKLPFAQQFGSSVASALLSLHKQKGVRFVLGVNTLQVTSRYIVVEQSGSPKQINGDFVILGVGVEPSLKFEHDLPLAADGGILTDQSLRARGKVWVAGDIANVAGLRIEHWRVAQQHGMHAAKQMLGQRMPLRNVPFFWTYHFDKTIKYLGHADEWDDVSIIGNVRRLNFIALLTKGDAVIAVVSCDRDEETALLSELMRKPISSKQASKAIHSIRSSR